MRWVNLLSILYLYDTRFYLFFLLTCWFCSLIQASKRAENVPSSYSVTKSGSTSVSDLEKSKLSATLDWHHSDSSSSEIESNDSETTSSEDGLENLPMYGGHAIAGDDTSENGESSLDDPVFETDDDSSIKKITANSYEDDSNYFVQSSGTKSMAVVKRDATATTKCSVVPSQPRAKRVTSFMLWYSRNKSQFKTSHKNSNSRNPPNKKAGALWRALPSTEKAFWKREAMQLRLKNSSISSCQRSAASSRTISIDDPEYLLPEEKASLGCKPIDVAAHLKLLGSLLEATGYKLIETNPPLDPTGLQSNLLDIGLCAIASLLCLTREIAGLEHVQEDVFLRMLDHIAYFFPNMWKWRVFRSIRTERRFIYVI